VAITSVLAVNLLDLEHQLVIRAVELVANEVIATQPVPLDFTIEIMQVFATNIASVKKDIMGLLMLKVEFP